MNVELLRKVKEHILDEPQRLDMSMFGQRTEGEMAPPCGTTACIAGWAVILSDPKLFTVDIEEFDDVLSDAYKTGRELLRITPGQARRLFFVGGWPLTFKEKMRYLDMSDYDGTYGTAGLAVLKARAAVAAERIDYFIATDGNDDFSLSQGPARKDL